MNASFKLGATPRQGSMCEFLVWAPAADKVDVQIVSPRDRRLPLQKSSEGRRWGTGERDLFSMLHPSISFGYFHGVFEGVEPGTLYYYLIDGNLRRPDPASRFQPQGVHGPSQVFDSSFQWEDNSWAGPHLQDYVIYELHTGAFTPEGTFDALIDRLDELCQLGITAIELMPVGQFPGDRNWGYDGTYPFAVQNTYGGPDGLKRLVNACHRKGLAVVLDVVYNHLGPEGAYLGDFGPYFTDRYLTPWGMAVNFDGPCSDEVRRYFIENALYWVEEFHIDSLRIDAVHAIMDRSPHPFLEELSEAIDREALKLNRNIYLIAESDLNDVRLIHPRDRGGLGLHAHWNDDFHHALHTLLTGEKNGYYEDFGLLGQLAKAFREGFVYSGEYSVSRKRRHGSSTRAVAPQRLVVFSQNHDQIGNRLLGDRLGPLVSSIEQNLTGNAGEASSLSGPAFEALKLAAGAVLLSPFIPLLFMGEEYGETAPFQYFVSHSDPDLVESVRKGRAEEFAAFGRIPNPPDPQADGTFRKSKLRHRLKQEEKHRVLLRFYRELLRLRKMFVTPKSLSEVLSYEMEKVLLIRFGGEGQGLIVLLNFNHTAGSAKVFWPSGMWVKQLDSAEEGWGGEGSRIPHMIGGSEEIYLNFSPRSIALFIEQENA